MNRCELIGRLTRDPEVRKTETGHVKATFTLAINRIGTEENADYINCTVWNKQADNLGKYCHKGDLIGLEGSIRTRSYEKDGSKRYVTEVLADRIEYLSTKKGEIKEESQEVTTSLKLDDVELDDLEMPF